jgi:hypothetical protein
MLKTTGYILLAISCLSFILIPVIPFFDFPAKRIAAITTVLIIIGEVLFYTSMFILGKAFYAKLKAKLAFWKKKDKADNQNPESPTTL